MGHCSKYFPRETQSRKTNRRGRSEKEKREPLYSAVSLMIKLMRQLTGISCLCSKYTYTHTQTHARSHNPCINTVQFVTVGTNCT